MIFTLFVLVLCSEPTTLQKGDEYFRNQDYSAAISMYQNNLNGTQQDAESLWRIARATICLGDMCQRKEQEKHYRNALERSAAAVKLDSLNSNVQCWYAISLGYIAIFEGSKRKVEFCTNIQRALELSINLDPRNDVAFSVYGTFYRALGNVGWLERNLANLLLGGLPEGGYAEAETMLLKAIELKPNILRHRYELGLLYFDWGKENKGREIFRAALLLPVTLASDHTRIKIMKQKLLP